MLPEASGASHHAIGRNLVFYSGLVLLTLATIILSPLFFFLLRKFRHNSPGQAVRRIIWYYGHSWIKLTSLVVPFTSRTGSIGDYPSPCIIVANHQSFFDAFCMGALPIHELVFVVRAWPFRIPFYGPYMRRAQYLNSESMNHEQFLAEAAKLLKQGTSVIMFPEGTRSASGRLGRFYSGAFRLATETDTPIVPLCLKGTGGFLPRGKILIQKHPIHVEALPAIHPAAYKKYGASAHMEFKKAVKAAMSCWLIDASPYTAPDTDPA